MRGHTTPKDQKDGEDRGFMDDWYLDIRGVTGGERGALQMRNSVATKALR